MKKYLGIGALALIILGLGFLLGTGAIGDLVRGGEASIGGGADAAEADATTQALGNRYADSIGQPLGPGDQPITYSTAIRCRFLAEYAREHNNPTDFSSDQLAQIEANATAIAYNRASIENIPQGNVEVDAMEMGLREGAKKVGERQYNDSTGRLTEEELQARFAEMDRPLWREIATVCAPLAGS